jgi:PEP-CTERM motif
LPFSFKSPIPNPKPKLPIQMGRIEISHQTWVAEGRIAEQYRDAHNGQLPSTPFWNYVDEHFTQAVDTGNLARFEYYHGPVVTSWLEQNANPAPVYPVSSPVPPTVYVPAAHPPSPPHTGPCPVGVPEPPSMALFGIGLIFMWKLFRSRR